MLVGFSPCGLQSWSQGLSSSPFSVINFQEGLFVFVFGILLVLRLSLLIEGVQSINGEIFQIGIIQCLYLLPQGLDNSVTLNLQDILDLILLSGQLPLVQNLLSPDLVLLVSPLLLLLVSLLLLLTLPHHLLMAQFSHRLLQLLAELLRLVWADAEVQLRCIVNEQLGELDNFITIGLSDLFGHESNFSG